ncbi:hypothetical protein KAI32_03360 [Candidatus Pacearchaeota archaeon]|nr:hypothetical protein [Candidatus Pacearchaeota archaeon]
MKKGIEEHYSPKNSLNLKGLKKFVGINRKLSNVDRGLVYLALNSGSGNGILSTDSALIKTYNFGVEEYGLENCFICNPKDTETVCLS